MGDVFATFFIDFFRSVGHDKDVAFERDTIFSGPGDRGPEDPGPRDPGPRDPNWHALCMYIR